jgi:predicted alpha/beta hydrolase family esterase
MPERAFIIHGYQGYPEEAWQPWLKFELEKRGFRVALPAMPHPDLETVIIGHSLGALAVQHYLEILGGTGGSVGRTVLIASNFPLGMTPQAADERTGGDTILQPWLVSGLDPRKVKVAAGRCTAILSDNDPYIPFEEAKASFVSSLGAKIIVEKGKGHFNEDDKITELPAALAAALR